MEPQQRFVTGALSVIEQSKTTRLRLKGWGRKILATFFSLPCATFFAAGPLPLAGLSLCVGGKNDENFSHFFRGSRRRRARAGSGR